MLIVGSMNRYQGFDRQEIFQRLSFQGYMEEERKALCEQSELVFASLFLRSVLVFNILCSTFAIPLIILVAKSTYSHKLVHYNIKWILIFHFGCLVTHDFFRYVHYCRKILINLTGFSLPLSHQWPWNLHTGFYNITWAYQALFSFSLSKLGPSSSGWIKLLNRRIAAPLKFLI
ncbi:unnamed protein product [Angiostrongylus costaricensis]|uniref:Glycerophosphocholine acyltransferase 1 n=1 Tax=Angiostrongylus costaricensis TaxID=334426 RepID=A0A0R3PYZ3_ANGCS|nr:unnamed protein product [Angiostrongylus costaricensis]